MSTRTPHSPLPASAFDSAFPASTKVYVDGRRGVCVPMRELALTNGGTLRVYDASGPHGHDAREGLPKLRQAWVAPRKDSKAVTQLHCARRGEITREIEFVA